MLFLVVDLHGARITGGEATAGNVAAVRRITAMSVQVFTQVNQVLTATTKAKGKLQ